MGLFAYHTSEVIPLFMLAVCRKTDFEAKKKDPSLPFNKEVHSEAVRSRPLGKCHGGNQPVLFGQEDSFDGQAVYKLKYPATVDFNAFPGVFRRQPTWTIDWRRQMAEVAGS